MVWLQLICLSLSCSYYSNQFLNPTVTVAIAVRVNSHDIGSRTRGLPSTLITIVSIADNHSRCITDSNCSLVGDVDATVGLLASNSTNPGTNHTYQVASKDTSHLAGLCLE